MSLEACNIITKCGDNRGTSECLLRRGHRRSMQVSSIPSDSVYFAVTFVGSELCSWDRTVATLQTSGHPLSLAFHSYDPHLIVANESDAIRCVPFR